MWEWLGSYKNVYMSPHTVDLEITSHNGQRAYVCIYMYMNIQVFLYESVAGGYPRQSLSGRNVMTRE